MQRRLFNLLWISALILLPAQAQGQGSYRFNAQASGSSAPMTVNFSASGVPGDQGVSWDFGDNTAGSGVRVTHVYYRPGTYTAQVSISDRLGVVARGNMVITVQGASTESVRVTLLFGNGSVAVSSEGSALYTPIPASLSLDGRAVSETSVVRVTEGGHAARIEARASSGQLLSRSVPFTVLNVTERPAFDLEVLRLTNDARARGWNCASKSYGDRSRPALVRNAQLDAAARAQSVGMVSNNYFDHVSPVDGSTPAQRVRASGYAYRMTGENIAVGQRTPAEVVAAWLRSPGHCANIMGEFTEIGLSYVERPGSPYGSYWTQEFASRQ